MFNSQDELIKIFPSYMTINLVGCNYLHESLSSLCIDNIEGDYTGRIRVVSLLNSDQLLYKKPSKDRTIMSFGMINSEWNRKTLVTRPGTVLLVYDARAKPDSITWKDFENSIFLDISKVKKMDNYQWLNIISLIFTTNNSFSFDSVNEDKERNYSLKKIIDPKNIYYINGNEGLKNISKRLSAHIVKVTVNYYRQIKKHLKNKKYTSNEIKEKQIKYNIKLGLVSQIKNRKKNTKYFEEAYAILSSVNLKHYYYGSNNIKLNYFEIKSIADWLYFRIFSLKASESLETCVSSFNFHMSNFSDYELANLDENNFENKLGLIELYWKIIRYEFFGKFLDEKAKKEFCQKNTYNFPGYYYMVINIKYIFRCQHITFLV